MLILDRRLGQRIVIGDDVFVSVENISWGKVRLGISAPKSVAVDREEIRRAKDADRPQGALEHEPVAEDEPAS